MLWVHGDASCRRWRTFLLMIFVLLKYFKTPRHFMNLLWNFAHCRMGVSSFFKLGSCKQFAVVLVQALVHYTPVPNYDLSQGLCCDRFDQWFVTVLVLSQLTWQRSYSNLHYNETLCDFVWPVYVQSYSPDTPSRTAGLNISIDLLT